MNHPSIQPFSQKSLTATVPKVFQIGLCGVVEADLELICNSWSVGLLGERLYVRRSVPQVLVREADGLVYELRGPPDVRHTRQRGHPQTPQDECMWL